MRYLFLRYVIICYSLIYLYRSLHSGISSVIRILKRLSGRFSDDRLIDVTDSRRYRSPQEARSEHFLRVDGQPSDRFGVRSRFYDSSLSPIYRTTDGRFVLDKDSEEGGFTSPRKPIRILTQTRTPLVQIRRPSSSYPRWAVPGVGVYYDQLQPTMVEGGVYDVRAGTTHALVHRGPEKIDERMVGSDEVGFRGPYTQALVQSQTSFPSPQFGQHTIPDTFVRSPRFMRQRIRSSSPRHFVDDWNQLSHLVSFSEVSSVQQPSSVERSFPSTILSSFQASLQKTPSTAGTPLNAAALLRDHINAEYDRVIGEQQYLLDKNKFLLRQQEMRVPTSYARSYDPHMDIRYPSSSGYVEYLSTWMSPQGPLYLSPHSQPPASTRYEAPSSPLYHPPYREPLIIVPEPCAIPPHYVNVTSRQHASGRRPPYYLLKPPLPPPADTVKPLATSSPPRIRSRRMEDRQALESSSKSYTDLKSPIEAPLVSDFSGRKFIGSTPDRNHGLSISSKVSSSKDLERPHSAPNFGSFVPSKDLDNKYQKVLSHPRRPTQEDTSHEKSDEFSPSSSSGFGSKNTSQQQSSQSGQSASALGLDTSRLDTSDTMKSFQGPPEIPQKERYLNLGVNVMHMTPAHYPTTPYNHWHAQRVLPSQERASIHVPSSSLLMGIPRDQFDEQTLQYQQPSPLYQNTMGRKAPPVARSSKPPAPAPPPRPTHTVSSVPPNLDISVDDHYEFDTLLSPMPEEGDSFWSRSHSALGGHPPSDSGRPISGDQRKDEHHESMEARVAAMKEEFHQYRQRQAKKRSDRELESVC